MNRPGAVHSRFHRSSLGPSEGSAATESIVKLWMLRILVPLNGARALHKESLNEHDY